MVSSVSWKRKLETRLSSTRTHLFLMFPFTLLWLVGLGPGPLSLHAVCLEVGSSPFLKRWVSDLRCPLPLVLCNSACVGLTYGWWIMLVHFLSVSVVRDCHGSFSLPFFSHATQCVGSWFPNQGSNFVFPSLEAWSLNHRTAGSPRRTFLWVFVLKFVTVLVEMLGWMFKCIFQLTVLLSTCLVCLGDRLTGFRHGWSAWYGRCSNRTQGAGGTVVSSGLSVMESMTKSTWSVINRNKRKYSKCFRVYDPFEVHEKTIVLELDSCVYKTKPAFFDKFSFSEIFLEEGLS